MQDTAGQRDELFRLLVESVRDYAIFLLDPQGYIRTWNEGARHIKGYSADEVIGKHFSIFYSPAEIRRGKPEYGLRVALTEGRWEEEGWRIRKDGSRFWASVVITALFAADRQHVGFAKVTRDLSERKRAEEERTALLELERRARAETEAALEQLRAVQTVTEAALAHLDLDRLLTALLDRIGDTMSADSVVILLLQEDEQALTPWAAKGGEEVEAGIRLPLDRGIAGRIATERRPIALDDIEDAEVLDPIMREKAIRSLLGTPLIIEGRVTGVLQVGTRYHRRFTEADIAFVQIVADRVALALDHARLYETARLAREEALEAIRAVQLRDDFLSTAAHELKTPVTSLRGFAELLMRVSDRGEELDPARYHRAVHTINRQAQSLSHLMNQLLAMSRLDSGRLELDRQMEDLTRLVRRAVEQAQAQTERHQLSLAAPGAVHARVDPFRFEQVVTNLLDNAIKYSPDGGRIDVELTQPTPERARLTVRDRGIGIPSDQQAHIFDRYHQAHADSHRSGLGLGLYLSREIVERHGGRLWAEAADGDGTAFVADIPVNGDHEGRS